jgi:hypothetical protein
MKSVEDWSIFTCSIGVQAHKSSLYHSQCTFGTGDEPRIQVQPVKHRTCSRIVHITFAVQSVTDNYHRPCLLNRKQPCHELSTLNESQPNEDHVLVGMRCEIFFQTADRSDTQTGTESKYWRSRRKLLAELLPAWWRPNSISTQSAASAREKSLR